MLRATFSSLLRYGIALAAVAIALALTLLITPLRDQSHSPLFFAAVVLSAWWGGLGPGLLASALSAWAIDYFLVPPAYALVLGVEDVIRIGTFLLVALLITWLDTRRRQLEGALRQRAAELAEAHRHKDRFLATLAHELRNPIGAIHHALHCVRLRTNADPTVGQSCDLVERQVRQMTRLVGDLLDITRIAQGKVQLREEEVDLIGVVARAVETVRPMIESGHHELAVSVPEEPLLVCGDPDRLEQVVGNVLQNAAKYTEEGGRIWLALNREGGHVVLRVRDTGIGIAPELLPHVFEPFVQAPRSQDGVRDGLGIGLALVKNLVELHGGSVQASSAGPGQGSEFLVRLPQLASACPDPLKVARGTAG